MHGFSTSSFHSEQDFNHRKNFGNVFNNYGQSIQHTPSYPSRAASPSFVPSSSPSSSLFSPPTFQYPPPAFGSPPSFPLSLPSPRYSAFSPPMSSSSSPSPFIAPKPIRPASFSSSSSSVFSAPAPSSPPTPSFRPQSNFSNPFSSSSSSPPLQSSPLMAPSLYSRSPPSTSSYPSYPSRQSSPHYSSSPPTPASRYTPSPAFSSSSSSSNLFSQPPAPPIPIQEGYHDDYEPQYHSSPSQSSSLLFQRKNPFLPNDDSSSSSSQVSQVPLHKFSLFAISDQNSFSSSSSSISSLDLDSIPPLPPSAVSQAENPLPISSLPSQLIPEYAPNKQLPPPPSLLKRLLRFIFWSILFCFGVIITSITAILISPETVLPVLDSVVKFVLDSMDNLYTRLYSVCNGPLSPEISRLDDSWLLLFENCGVLLFSSSKKLIMEHLAFDKADIIQWRERILIFVQKSEILEQKNSIHFFVTVAIGLLTVVGYIHLNRRTTSRKAQKQSVECQTSDSIFQSFE